MAPDLRRQGSAEANFGVILDLSPVPTIMLSPSYHILRTSRSFLEAWQIKADDCLGLDLFDFLRQEGLVSGGRDPTASLERVIQDAIAARALCTDRVVYERQETTWSIRVIPVSTDYELVSLLLEWQQKSKSGLGRELQHRGLSTDEEFGILVDTVKDYAIFLLDTDGRVVTWNMGAELHKGYTKDEIVGKHFSVFYGKGDIEARKPEKELEISIREGKVEAEGWRYRKDGSRFWCNAIITPVYKDGVHIGFSKVTRDLTEQKAAESRLIKAYEESSELKSAFLANMSHEIRTPMHGMLSACTLLLDTPLTDNQREAANIIEESGQVLLQIINDILDYSKLTSGNFSISCGVVCVTNVITSVVRSVRATLRPSVHFQVFLDQDLPDSAQGDPLRYRQIVQNLISNAAKFTEEGSICARVSLQQEGEDSYSILTEVTDTGIGISDMAAKSLFNPFTQLDSTTRKRYQGTGLGLAIAKSLTELMGGQIGYRPNPEQQGSIFWFTVRLKKIKSMEQAQGPSANSSDHSRAQQPTLSGLDPYPLDFLRSVAPTKRLLVVEDNLINQRAMVAVLQSLGFSNIQLASDGAQAVVLAGSVSSPYDLVLMDINMPVVDGYRAAAEIRESGVDVPIVAMTANALKGDRELCLDRGMDDYISKPVDKHDLVQVLLKWLVRNVHPS